jgi:solute:Na+ symporter, SSS family
LTEAASQAGKLTFFHPGWGSGFWQDPYTLFAGVLGGAFLSMASHGTDQLIVQRILTTKSLRDGRKALIGSGVIIVAQFLIFLMVGILLYGHYGGASLSSLGVTRADEIFPKFIVEGLPPGISGFIIAGLFAAALSTIAGSISSMSSSTVFDLYPHFRGRAVPPEQSLRLSRTVTVVWAGLLVCSALFFMNTSQTVIELALSIASFTYGGLLGTFLLGVLSKRARQEDALGGFVAGIFFMITVISLHILAWTWFTLVGVIATLVVGNLLSALSGPRNVTA